MTLTPVHRRAIPALCFAFTMLAAVAEASTTSACGAPSPTLERLGADYRLLEPEPLERLPADRRDPRGSDTPRLARLLETLRTASLEGIDGERMRCLGDGDDMRAIRWRFDLEQLERVQLLNGQTVLTAFEARRMPRDEHERVLDDGRRVDGALVAEVVDMPHPQAWHPGADGASLESSRRFRRAGAASATCTVTSRAVLSADEIRRGKKAARCSSLAEIGTTARAVGRSVEIEQVLYIGGRLSERVLWRIGS